MAQSRHAGRVRIIGGQWRHRQLRFYESGAVRPTPDAIRETLFNWLQDSLDEAVCVDLFAGSGALGFEAASRGAARVVLVERDPRCAAALRENRRRLQAHNVEVVGDDAIRYLRRSQERFDVAFVDPPFNLGLVPKVCRVLAQLDRMKSGALVYVETERALSQLVPAPGWEVVRSKTAGAVAYRLLRCGPSGD